MRLERESPWKFNLYSDDGEFVLEIKPPLPIVLDEAIYDKDSGYVFGYTSKDKVFVWDVQRLSYLCHVDHSLALLINPVRRNEAVSYSADLIQIVDLEFGDVMSHLNTRNVSDLNFSENGNELVITDLKGNNSVYDASTLAKLR
jgi:WD40 repeat protein